MKRMSAPCARLLSVLTLLLAACPARAALTPGADSVRVDRFSSAGRWVRTYPGHVLHVLAPLGDARRTAIGFAGAAAIVALARTQDAAVDDWVSDERPWGAASDFASNTLPAIMAIAYAAPAVALPAAEGNGRCALVRTEGLLEAVAAQGLIVEGIKHLTNRDRPNGSRFAFPSGHTTYAFTLAALADATFGAKAGVPAFAAATLVGASRISLRRHWLSDVVAGAVLGTTIGELVGRRDKRGEDDPSLAAGWSPDRGIVLQVRVPVGR